MNNMNNSRVMKLETLLAPSMLKQISPASTRACQTVHQSRQHIQNVLDKKDNRIIAIVGPCSIHDPISALEYANKLAQLACQLKDALVIVMRTYFEKPRTTVGWKGYINDPNLDNSCDINLGLKKARQLLIEINQLGLPVATEFLDTIIPQYIADLISWGAIGARTSESQNHRNLVSGLSMPMGIKNSTTGFTQIAIDAIITARHPHSFLGINDHGAAGIVHTRGNPYTHIILRGGNLTGPNYNAGHIQQTSAQLAGQHLPRNIMVDCSHGNSYKDHQQQPRVVDNIAKQLAAHDSPIVGIMLESFLQAGKQPLQTKLDLEYGKSITDACMDWTTTENCLHTLADAVRLHRYTRKKQEVA